MVSFTSNLQQQQQQIQQQHNYNISKQIYEKNDYKKKKLIKFIKSKII